MFHWAGSRQDVCFPGHEGVQLDLKLFLSRAVLILFGELLVDLNSPLIQKYLVIRGQFGKRDGY